MQVFAKKKSENFSDSLNQNTPYELTVLRAEELNLHHRAYETRQLPLHATRYQI